MLIVEKLRDRSIIRHSRDIKVPDFNNPPLILKGVGQYAAIYVNCHLAPGITSSKIRIGQYPRLPELWDDKIADRHEKPNEESGTPMADMPGMH